MDNYFILTPDERQIALAYAQARFSEWLSQNHSEKDFPRRRSAFYACLDEGVRLPLTSASVMACRSFVALIHSQI